MTPLSYSRQSNEVIQLLILLDFLAGTFKLLNGRKLGTKTLTWIG